MAEGFVWFHHGSAKSADSVAFYQGLLGWKPAPGPSGMTMFAGEKGPFAAAGAPEGAEGWIPFAEVTDVDEATKKATGLGATVLQAKTRGPAGQYAVLRDPGGAAIALWQKA